jgi:hypothetical protein
MEREELGEVDISRSEGVEVELNRLIVKRSPQEIDAEERDELWKASVAAYNARRLEETRLAWREYHRGQAERHKVILEGLIAEHEAQAEKYEMTGEGG